MGRGDRMNTASEMWQVEDHAIWVSDLKKLFWPEAVFTKSDTLRYYMQIEAVAFLNSRLFMPSVSSRVNPLASLALAAYIT